MTTFHRGARDTGLPEREARWRCDADGCDEEIEEAVAIHTDPGDPGEWWNLRGVHLCPDHRPKEA